MEFMVTTSAGMRDGERMRADSSVARSAAAASGGRPESARKGRRRERSSWLTMGLRMADSLNGMDLVRSTLRGGVGIAPGALARRCDWPVELEWKRRGR